MFVDSLFFFGFLGYNFVSNKFEIILMNSKEMFV